MCIRCVTTTNMMLHRSGYSHIFPQSNQPSQSLARCQKVGFPQASLLDLYKARIAHYSLVWDENLRRSLRCSQSRSLSSSFPFTTSYLVCIRAYRKL